MSQGNSIKVKALILLMVFSLNTVVGFACAIGLDTEFNSKHHDKEKKHQHTNNITEHRHDDGTIHHHHDNTSSNNHHENPDTQSEDKDDCCSDGVIKFNQADKNITNTIKANFSNPIVTTIFYVLFINHFPSFSKTINGKALDRWPSLPPPDIRVSIQSFQI